MRTRIALVNKTALRRNEMKSHRDISFACFCSLALVAGMAVAKPEANQRHQLTISDVYVDVVGDVDGTHPAP